MAGFGNLFVYVINLTRPAPTDDGFSLSDVVSEIRAHVEQVDVSALDALDGRLVAAGYRDEDDYSDSLWMETGARAYEVKAGFPCIRSSSLLAGVRRVRYEIALLDCDAFAVEEATLRAAIVEQAGART
jgi:hypothetical protein